jgi:hypothetical protein
MAIQRQMNFKGQMRIDVPHLRSIESAIAGDFDTLAGGILSGKQPYIVRGFTLSNTGAASPAINIQVNTAGGVVLHYGASESGTILMVPTNRAAEQLVVTNARVQGGFTSGQDNYIGIDFIREEDSSTSDVVQFIDAVSKVETPKTIPLARSLDYKIVISTTPFSSAPTICPLAVVRVAADGTITWVKDARSMYFRLATGGDSPNPLGLYAWPEGRNPESVNSFAGGDKAITHEREWKSAVMQRLWEISGGEYWYSDTTDRNTKFIRSPPGTLADNFTWDGTTVKWEGLGIVLSNSTASYNSITGNTGAGLTLADGECLYVDVDRFTQNAVLTMQKGTASALGTPGRVGSRFVLAWRKGALLYARGNDTEIGRVLPLATTAVTGILRTSTAQQISGVAYAVVADAVGGKGVVSGLLSNGNTALT